MGEVLFYMSGKLPRVLKIVPKKLLEKAALLVNRRIMDCAKGKFVSNLSADVEQWVVMNA